MHQIVYFPYLAMGQVETVRLGRASVWNIDLYADRIADPALRERVLAIVGTHRTMASASEKTHKIRGVGVATLGELDFRVLSPREIAEVRSLRYALFLGGLANNMLHHDRDAAHDLTTSENYDLFSQEFDLTSKYFAETAGMILEFRRIGYELGKAVFLKPSHVSQPHSLNVDLDLISALDTLRHANRELFSRILRAASLLIGSYYNSHVVDIGARVVMQAAAFEVLLHLPLNGQRKEFKDRIEVLFNSTNERRYSYTFEVHGKRRREARSTYGIWADRFYTLRNHIAHGHDVRNAEYIFRGLQHHVLIGAMVFVMTAKTLINQWYESQGRERPFFERLRWVPAQSSAPEASAEGFIVERDTQAYLERYLERMGWP